MLEENVTDYAIFTIDVEGCIASWNVGAERILGYQEAEIIGQPVALIFTPEDRAHGVVEQELSKAAISGRAEDERWHLRQDGSRFWASGVMTALRDESGNLRAFAKILRDFTRRKAAETQQHFIVAATTLLASSLDYQTTLQSVALSIVPHLADWCVVHLLNDAGVLELVTAAHVDPTKVEGAHESSRRYPPRLDAQRGIAAVLRSGKSDWLENITDDMIRAAAQDEGHYQMLSALGMRSYLCVPLVARGKSLGAITFIGAETAHRYSADSLPLAEELARHAAIAVDNARLYAAAQKEIEERQRAEAALQESRDYYRTLTEAVPQLV